MSNPQVAQRTHSPLLPAKGPETYFSRSWNLLFQKPRPAERARVEGSGLLRVQDVWLSARKPWIGRIEYNLFVLFKDRKPIILDPFIVIFNFQ